MYFPIIKRIIRETIYRNTMFYFMDTLPLSLNRPIQEFKNVHVQIT